MPDTVTLIFSLIWLIALFIAMWAFRVAQFFVWRMPKVAARELPEQFPQVAVIVPIKGVDADTRENISALLNQNYPQYRLIFSVESADDPVIALLNELVRNHPAQERAVIPIDIAVAGRATHSGQKIHNQLAAFARTTEADAFLAFMDADARPGANWLRAQIGNMVHTGSIGCATGYRFYIPEKQTFANNALMVINAGVMVLLGPLRRNFAWGGSMTLRRADFVFFGIAEQWAHALSDDFVVSTVVKKQRNPRRPIAFIPQCIVASRADFIWSQLWEFATRQYRITRICVPHVWLCALLGPLIYLVAWGYALGMSVYAFWGKLPAPLEPMYVWLAYLALCGLTIARGICILMAARTFLPQHWPVIRKAWFWFTLGMPVIHLINLLLVMGSAFGRQITWRGITYCLVSRTDTRIISPQNSDS